MARSIKAAALGLMAGLWGSCAWAAPAVTAPSGGTHTVGTPLTVTWSGFPGANVHLEIVLLGSSSSVSVITYPWMASVPNTGSYTGPSPALFCTPQPGLDKPISQWTAMGLVGSVGQAAQAIGPQFKLACPQVGSLSVKKVVVNATGGAPPPAYPPFVITVDCTPPSGSGKKGTRTPVSVGAGQAVSLAGLLPAGTTCRATETPPLAVRALRACKGRLATWTTTYSPAAVIPAGGAATLTVTNTLACAPA